MNIETILLQNVIKKKGYAWFDKGTYNLNLIGVRSSIQESGRFDDFITATYKDSKGAWICKFWKATTDAGSYWLQHPMNAKGTALLVPNQYRGAWQIGLHKGQYKALVQFKPVSVYRDNDKDKITEFKPESIQTGMFGINIHRSNPKTISTINDKWSAGCQVFASPNDYEEFMSLIELSAKQYGDKFTYTLLTEQDFNGL